MGKALVADFVRRPADKVARDLLGKQLVAIASSAAKMLSAEIRASALRESN